MRVGEYPRARGSAARRVSARIMPRRSALRQAAARRPAAERVVTWSPYREATGWSTCTLASPSSSEPVVSWSGTYISSARRSAVGWTSARSRWKHRSATSCSGFSVGMSQDSSWSLASSMKDGSNSLAFDPSFTWNYALRQRYKLRPTVLLHGAVARDARRCAGGKALLGTLEREHLRARFPQRRAPWRALSPVRRPVPVV